MMTPAILLGLFLGMIGSATWIGVALHIAHELHMERAGWRRSPVFRRELLMAYSAAVAGMVATVATLAAMIRLALA